MKWFTLLFLVIVSSVQAQQRMPFDPFDPQPINAQPVNALIGNDFPSNEVKNVVPSYARVVELRWQRDQSHKDLVRTIDNLRDDFERSDSLQSAIRTQQSAYDSFVIARDSALLKLNKDLRYNALRGFSVDLERKIEISKSKKVDVRSLADLRLVYNRMMTDIEVRVLESDEGYRLARERLLDVSGVVRRMRENFERGLRRSNDFLFARGNYNSLTI